MNILIINDKYAKLAPLTPLDVKDLTSKKIEVSFYKSVGLAAGYRDEEYISAGAKKISKLDEETLKPFNVILSSTALKYEPIYRKTNPNQLFMVNQTMVNDGKTLYHMVKYNNICLSTDCIHEDGVYPYNIPYEQVKGSYAPLIAADLLIKNKKEASGKCLGSFNYSKQRVTFVILNFSYAGYYAAKNALALGANVIYLESNKNYQDELKNDDVLNDLAKMNKSTFDVESAAYEDILRACTKADVLIATNMLSTIRTSMRITREMISKLQPNGIYIDLACEAGPSSEFTTKYNKIEKSACENNAVLVAYNNIPSLFPKTMSEIFGALNAKYLEKIAKYNTIHEALQNEKELTNAVVAYRGKITNKDLATSLNLQFTEFNKISNK